MTAALPKTEDQIELERRIKRDQDRKKDPRRAPGKVYVVKKGGAIFWPDGELRGEGPRKKLINGREVEMPAYAVRADCPLMDDYFRAEGVPAMLAEVEDGDDVPVPTPPSEWEPRYREMAGEDYLTEAEKSAKKAKRAKKAKAKADAEMEQAKLEEQVQKEIPDPDED